MEIRTDVLELREEFFPICTFWKSSFFRWRCTPMEIATKNTIHIFLILNIRSKIFRSIHRYSSHASQATTDLYTNILSTGMYTS